MSRSVRHNHLPIYAYGRGSWLTLPDIPRAASAPNLQNLLKKGVHERMKVKPDHSSNPVSLGISSLQRNTPGAESQSPSQLTWGSGSDCRAKNSSVEVPIWAGSQALKPSNMVGSWNSASHLSVTVYAAIFSPTIWVPQAQVNWPRIWDPVMWVFLCSTDIPYVSLGLNFRQLALKSYSQLGTGKTGHII